jgi:hypothetical protein
MGLPSERPDIPILKQAQRVSDYTSYIYEIAASPSNPGNYSSAFPFVSGNCVVITAASKYPAAHK